LTGSSQFELMESITQSLAGRASMLTLLPFSLGELQRVGRAPSTVDQLLHSGLFPPIYDRPVEPSVWLQDYVGTYLERDVRQVLNIRGLATFQRFLQLCAGRIGQLVNISSLAADAGITRVTADAWLSVLQASHMMFLVRPWFTNVTKSLRKEPKWFLRDWSGIADPGKRAETFIACHLLKAVEGWSDLGMGTFELRYLRDKQQREVDFVVIRDRKPWFLVEVKSGRDNLSPALKHFQDQIKAPHAFQVVLDREFIAADCFARHEPTVVPARTLLSQLL